MSPLRCDLKTLRAATTLALCALVLTGCAGTAAPTHPADQSHRAGLPIHLARMSDAEAELVIGRAIAEHEMRRP